MLAGPLEAGSEHAHRVDLRLGRERADHAGAGGAVPAEIALVILLRDRVAVLVQGDEDGACNLADARCPCSTPLSSTQTLTPRPVAPASAQSRSTRSGSGFSSSIPSTALRGSDQAGRSSSSTTHH